MRSLRRIILWLLLVSPGLGLAQGAYYENTAFNANGNPVPHAWVRICDLADAAQPCTALVALYTDVAMTEPLDNPFRADEHGFYHFYLVAGTYRRQLWMAGTLVEDRIFSVGGGAATPVTVTPCIPPPAPLGPTEYQVVTGIDPSGQLTCVTIAIPPAPVTPLRAYPMAVALDGIPDASQVLISHPVVGAVNFLTDCADSTHHSHLVLGVAATATTVFSLQHCDTNGENCAEFGTATVAPAGKTATWACAVTAFADKEVFKFVAPGSPDATAANLGVGIYAIR